MSGVRRISTIAVMNKKNYLNQFYHIINIQYINLNIFIDPTSSIAFSVFFKDLTTVENGNTMKFAGITSNIGNHYNPVTGHFTCPKTGAYVFSVNLQSERHFQQA